MKMEMKMELERSTPAGEEWRVQKQLHLFTKVSQHCLTHI